MHVGLHVQSQVALVRFRLRGGGKGSSNLTLEPCLGLNMEEV